MRDSQQDGEDVVGSGVIASIPTTAVRAASEVAWRNYELDLASMGSVGSSESTHGVEPSIAEAEAEAAGSFSAAPELGSRTSCGRCL